MEKKRLDDDINITPISTEMKKRLRQIIPPEKAFQDPIYYKNSLELPPYLKEPIYQRTKTGNKININTMMFQIRVITEKSLS